MAVVLDYCMSTGVLHLDYQGFDDPHSRRNVLDAVIEHVRNHKSRKILIDARKLASDLPRIDLHAFGKRLAARPELTEGQIAFVYNSFEEGSEYSSIIVENLARIRTFDDFPAASDWLENTNHFFE